MRRLIYLVALAGVGLARPMAAQQTLGDTTRVHVVRDGDTLWDLAGQYLNDPFLWPEIFSANQQLVADPDRIYPDWRLLIPGFHSAAEFASVSTAPSGSVPMARPSTTTRRTPSRTVFFPQQVEEAGDVAVDRIAIARAEFAVVSRGDFLAAGVLVPDSVIAPLGRISGIISPTVVDRHEAPQIQPFDQVTMVVEGALRPGDRVHLIRPASVVPPYGRVFVATGGARVIAVSDGVATLEIDQMYDRVDIGDLAVAVPNYEVPVGVRPVAAGGLEGNILTFIGGEPVVGTGDRAFVNLGAASGVVEGDEFVAYLPAIATETARRPEIEVARLRVVRVAELTSAVRVVELDQPALQPGMPIRLVARMPE